MKKRTVIFCFIVLTGIVLAQDIRDMVKSENDVVLPSRTINPDKHIFGILFGTHENEFIKNFGKPDCYIRLTGNETCMVYGKTIAFLFENKKLHGVHITHTIIDWKLSQRMIANLVFDNLRWKLTNGIQLETPLSEVKKILGNQLSTSSYKRTFTTSNAFVCIDFTHYTDAGENDIAYKVSGITIEKK